ncbi:MAG: NAD(P)-binding domain-containing protein, partial [Actinomycetota bacterium]
MIGVIGAGLVGTQVVESLIAHGQVQVFVNDLNASVASRLASRLSTPGATTSANVTAVETSAMFNTNVVVLACPAPHAKAARKLLEAGVSVVSCSDDLDDTLAMLDLDAVARQARQTLVVGAAMSPGLSGVLVRAIIERFSEIDEAHVAVHGTAGPACAQQHHRALAGQSIGWHDGDWLRRPAGSGRELCWFPDPVGPRDCYRAELADPALIHHG